MMSAITMTYAEEAIGVARAAAAVGLPAVISFTVETDGRLPSGQTLGDAIAQVDDACRVAPAYYMVNCAHPTHFSNELEAGAPWLARVHGVRANASRLSHAELDEATELDRGDIDELGALYAVAGLDDRPAGGRRVLRHRPRARRHDRQRPRPPFLPLLHRLLRTWRSCHDHDTAHPPPALGGRPRRWPARPAHRRSRRPRRGVDVPAGGALLPLPHHRLRQPRGRPLAAARHPAHRGGHGRRRRHHPRRARHRPGRHRRVLGRQRDRPGAGHPAPRAGEEPRAHGDVRQGRPLLRRRGPHVHAG